MENTFLVLAQQLSLERALDLFSKIITTGLRESYGEIDQQGQPQLFAELVELRDQAVGLRVAFCVLQYYRRHTDLPFL